MLRRLSIRSKLFIVVGIPVLFLILTGLLSYTTFQAIKINGPTYANIVQEKDLVADIHPPPEFAVEARGESLQAIAEIQSADDQTALDNSIVEVQRLEREFAERHAYWNTHLTTSKMQTSRQKLETVYSTGKAFFDTFDQELIPIARSKQLDQLNVVRDKLNTEYLAHKGAVQDLVAQSTTQQKVIEADARNLVRNRTLLLIGAIAAATALLALIGIMIAQLISRPISTMTQRATLVAEVELPETIAAIGAAAPGTPLPFLEPFPVESDDELGQLAGAFNKLQTAAVDMAAKQVVLSRNYGENLITIGRRNQGLVFRTLGLITELERNERDAGTLENLFRLDHLTTRMRRQAESLLVLAGDQPMSTAGGPVEIADVVRGALSEVDEFQRVDHADMEAVTVRGRNVHSVVHLLAELIENAITFSPPTSRVSILGRLTPKGYQLAITDRGLGMSPEELEDANARLNDPVIFEDSPARVLGHHVVSKLSERLGVVVRLHDNLPSQGLTALILLPVEILGIEAAPTMPAQAAAPAVSIDQEIEAALAQPAVESEMPFDPFEQYAQNEVISGPFTPFDQEAEPFVEAPRTVGRREALSLEKAVQKEIPVGFDEGPMERAVANEVPELAVAQLQTDVAADAPAQDDAAWPWPLPKEDDRLPDDVAPRVADAAPMTKTGFRKRVKGAQAPDTGPASTDHSVPERDAAALRSSLAGLQSGFDRAKRS